MALHFAADIQKLRAENTSLKAQLSQVSNTPNQNALMIELSQLREENSRMRQSKIDLIMATAMEMERLRRFIGVLSEALRGNGFTAYDIRNIEHQITINHAPLKASSRGDGRRASVDDNPDLGRTDTLHIGTSTSRGQKERKKSLDLLETYPDFAVDGSSSTSPEPLAGGIVNMVDEQPKPKKSSVKDIVQALSTLDKGTEVPVPKSLSQRKEPADTRDSFHRHLPSAVNEFNSTDRKYSIGSDDSDGLGGLEIVKEENIITTAHNTRTEAKSINNPPNTGRTTPANGMKSESEATRTPANTVVKSNESTEESTEVASKPLSLKERMAALHGNMEKTDQDQEDRVNKIKNERAMHNVKVSGSKDKIGDLFNKRNEKSKEKAVAGAADAKAGSILKDALKEPTVEKAAVVMESLNLFTAIDKKPDFRKKTGGKAESKTGDEKEASGGGAQAEAEAEEEEKHEVLNMNNNTMMKKMTDAERENMKELICQSLIANKELKQVQMCNAELDDAFLKRILDTLSKPECNDSQITELWLESNPIGNAGMASLGNFLRTNDTIQVIKMYNNKKDISTAVLNEFLEAMDSNKTLVKFVFDGFRLQQMRDKRDKVLRRNQDLARKRRNEEKKRLAAANK